MEKSNYFRRVVIDLDDTISQTINRDFENAKPIQSVINKINYLYDNGWEVIILTARGQLSCDSDYMKADDKYRSQIEAWLNKYGVKYSELSFNKILAAYYVDDKALSPISFSQLDIKVIKNGWSGAIVEKRGNLIYKTHPNVINEAFWYNLMKGVVPCPSVHSLIGDTICLQYIESSGEVDLNCLIGFINKFSENTVESPGFYTYIVRMRGHLMYNADYWEILKPLEENEDFFNSLRSMCHGDFSLDNILVDSAGIHYCIDPIYDSLCYSSWVLDVSKLLHSLRRYDKMGWYNILMDFYGNIVGREMLLLLEITQFIRTIKYINNQEIKVQFEKIIKTLIDEFFNVYTQSQEGR